MLTYEKQALSGAIEVLLRSELPDEFEGQSYTALPKKMSYGRTVKFFGCQMKQGMTHYSLSGFFWYELYYNDIHMDIAIKIKPQLKT